MKRTAITAAVLLVCAAMGWQTAQADPMDVPYMEVQYAQLPDGNWEYIYDLYGGGVTHLVRTGLCGFDASAVINQFGPVDIGGMTGTLVQKWDYVAATDDPPWYRASFGSYSTDGATWTLLTESDYPGASAWTMDNPWHAPSEYAGFPSVFGPIPSFVFPGQITPDGQGLVFTTRISSGGALEGLLLTFRIVHANSPGPITWSAHSYESLETTGTILGPVVPEPATMSLLGLGGLTLLRRRKGK